MNIGHVIEYYSLKPKKEISYRYLSTTHVLNSNKGVLTPYFL